MSAFTFFNSMGGAIGVAVLGSVLNTRTQTAINGVLFLILDLALTFSVIAAGNDQPNAVSLGLNLLFLVCLIPTLVQFVATFFLKQVDILNMEYARPRLPLHFSRWFCCQRPTADRHQAGAGAGAHHNGHGLGLGLRH